jgi:hypothetical protein
MYELTNGWQPPGHVRGDEILDDTLNACVVTVALAPKVHFVSDAGDQEASSENDAAADDDEFGQRVRGEITGKPEAEENDANPDQHQALGNRARFRVLPAASQVGAGARNTGKLAARVELERRRWNGSHALRATARLDSSG